MYQLDEVYFQEVIEGYHFTFGQITGTHYFQGCCYKVVIENTPFGKSVILEKVFDEVIKHSSGKLAEIFLDKANRVLVEKNSNIFLCCDPIGKHFETGVLGVF